MSYKQWAVSSMDTTPAEVSSLKSRGMRNLPRLRVPFQTQAQITLDEGAATGRWEWMPWKSMRQAVRLMLGSIQALLQRPAPGPSAPCSQKRWKWIKVMASPEDGKQLWPARTRWAHPAPPCAATCLSWCLSPCFAIFCYLLIRCGGAFFCSFFGLLEFPVCDEEDTKANSQSCAQLHDSLCSLLWFICIAGQLLLFHLWIVFSILQFSFKLESIQGWKQLLLCT